MSWIRIVEPEEAAGTLREAYDKVGAARKSVASILKIHSVAPSVMTRHLDLYRQIMFSRSDLTRAERELIATAVSSANKCHY